MAYLAQTKGGQPILILKEGTSRSRGKEAQRNNIMVAKVIAEAIREKQGRCWWRSRRNCQAQIYEGLESK